MPRLTLSRALITLAALVGSDSTLHAQRAAARDLYELIVLPGGGTTWARGANRSGEVAGSFLGGAYAWTRSTGMVTLAPLAGSSSAFASDVNNHGVVVGTSSSPSIYKATLWQASGSAQAILVPGVGGSSAVAINNAGLVVGTSNLGSWVWDAVNGAQLLGPLGVPTNCYVRDLNESAQMVGGQPNASAWRFDLGTSTFTYLGTLGGLYSGANAINDLGHVVGESMISWGAYEYTPFLWTPEEGIFWLGTIEPSWMFMFQGSASCVNDDDEVVGGMRVQGDRTHAFLWDRTYGMRDLNDLVRHRGPYELQNATTITNTGWIVGRALDTSASDAPVAFVLRPR